MSEKKRMINSDLEDRMTLDWQGTRAFFYGMGYNDEDIEKPRVGIMNTWNEINPGHIHQQPLAQAVRQMCIRDSRYADGGWPREHPHGYRYRRLYGDSLSGWRARGLH